MSSERVDIGNCSVPLSLSPSIHSLCICTLEEKNKSGSWNNKWKGHNRRLRVKIKLELFVGGYCIFYFVVVAVSKVARDVGNRRAIERIAAVVPCRQTKRLRTLEDSLLGEEEAIAQRIKTICRQVGKNFNLASSYTRCLQFNFNYSGIKFSPNAFPFQHFTLPLPSLLSVFLFFFFYCIFLSLFTQIFLISLHSMNKSQFIIWFVYTQHFCYELFAQVGFRDWQISLN